MATELDELAEEIRCHQMLASGRAQDIARRAGLTNAAIGRAIDVSAASVWNYFNAGRVPRRRVALRLVRLLVALENALAVSDAEARL